MPPPTPELKYAVSVGLKFRATDLRNIGATRGLVVGAPTPVQDIGITGG